MKYHARTTSPEEKRHQRTAQTIVLHVVGMQRTWQGSMGRWGLLVVLAGSLACATTTFSRNGAAGTEQSGDSSAYHPPKATKHSGCTTSRVGLPDRACTPGGVKTSDRKVLCGAQASKRWPVPRAVHNAVLKAYGHRGPAKAFEVDHLIPLELGGDNTLDNLWPQSTGSGPGVAEKDEVEHILHKQICDGKMGIRDAQERIATDWIRLWEDLVVLGEGH